MKLKSLAMVTAAAFAAVGFDTASACSFSAWGQGLAQGAGTVASAGTATTSGSTANGNPTTASLVAGEPDDFLIANGVAVARYAGRCGSLSKALGNYVQDGLPAGEKTYRVRFYVFTGLSSGSAVVFRALDGASAEKIRVTYNRDGGNLEFRANGGQPTNAAVVPNAWYGVEFNWVANNPASMTATVRGNRSNTPVINAATVAGVSTADAIETAQLGWISGAGNGTIITDAFESRRSTDIGFLLRGDATGDNQFSGADLTSLRREFVGANLSVGQADCTENGVIDSADLNCLRRRIVGSE